MFLQTHQSPLFGKYRFHFCPATHFLVRQLSDCVRRTLIFRSVSLSHSVCLSVCLSLSHLVFPENPAIDFSDFCMKLSLRECENMTFLLFSQKFIFHGKIRNWGYFWPKSVRKLPFLPKIQFFEGFWLITSIFVISFG